MSLAASQIRIASIPGAERRSPRLPLLVIVAVFLALCLPLSYYLNIWQDEAYSLRSSSGSLLNALHQGLAFEAQAPLYFVALAAWLHINDTAFFARLLSVLFSVGTIVATWMLARQYIATIDTSIIVAVTAFNPLTVWAAVEMRPYAAAIMFSALLLLALFRGFFDESPSQWAQIGYLCLAVAGAYTQYYVAFLIPAHLFALLALRRWGPAQRLFLCGILVGLSLLPLVSILPQQLASYHAFAVTFKAPSYAMATVLFGYPFPHGWVETWAHRPIQNAIYFVIISVPIALGTGYVRQLRPVTQALLFMLLALFVMYTAAIVVAHVQILIPRHTLVMLVPMLVGALALIGDVVPARKVPVLASYGAVYALFAILTLWHDFHRMDKIGDWHRVSKFVASKAHSQDAVALFNAEAELPFKYYFRVPLPIVAIPRSMSFDRFDEAAFVLHGTSDVALSLGRLAATHKRVWLIESGACAPNYTFFNCRYLTQYVNEHMRVLGTTHFDGATVLEIEPLLQPRRRN